MDEDTILALASGPLPSAIALIRISGPRVADIIETCLSVGALKHRKATLCNVQGTDEKPIDQAVATLFRGPNSFTGEDSLELTVHGGRAVVDAVVSLITSRFGVRLAEPGEFTRRAVLAGKMDLLEAEGVADLVDAETEAQRAQALAQLRGQNSSAFVDWHARLVEVMALIEVVVDFPDEEDAPDHTNEDVVARLERLRADLVGAKENSRAGLAIRDGFSVVIIGPPNAGKSSLLNQLAGRDVAIVTDTPGTTRDVIEVRLNLGGYLVRVSDTAGLRTGAEEIEAEGIRRARAAAEEADILVGVYDASSADGLPSEFDALKPDLIVANKIDLVLETLSVSRETLRLSAQTGEGVATLVSAISAQIEANLSPMGHASITRQRHAEAVDRAIEDIDRALLVIKSGMGPELAAEDIRLAARRLEMVLGRVDVEEILGKIFSSFCIGK
ncbi:MAG: tRNA uridine-5-carboxymethylaminomethyl(34) synthesis GTPase MnmE [Pseudomonadota bacterium]